MKSTSYSKRLYTLRNSRYGRAHVHTLQRELADIDLYLLADLQPYALAHGLLKTIPGMVCFIIFDVVKMIVNTNLIQKTTALLRSPLPRSCQTELLKHLNQMVLDEESGSLRFMRFWGISTTVAVGTALAGACILGWAFVASLLKRS